MHRPVLLLRCMFGPHPPNANAGVTADDRAAARITIPSSVAESFFMKPSRSHAPELSPQRYAAADHTSIDGRPCTCADRFFSPCVHGKSVMSISVQVFGRWNVEAVPTVRRPASQNLHRSG